MLSANSFNIRHNSWGNRPFVVQNAGHIGLPPDLLRGCVGSIKPKGMIFRFFEVKWLDADSGGPARPWRRGPRADRRSGLWVQNFSTDRWEDCRFRPQTVAVPVFQHVPAPRTVAGTAYGLKKQRLRVCCSSVPATNRGVGLENIYGNSIDATVSRNGCLLNEKHTCSVFIQHNARTICWNTGTAPGKALILNTKYRSSNN